MVEQTGSYYLDYAPEVVFDYIATPTHVAELAPSLEESSQCGVAENGAPIIEATYAVGNGIAEGTATLTPETFQEGEEIRYHIDDDIRGHIHWTFEQDGSGTRFTYDAEYEVTIPVPSLFMDTVGKYISEREIDALVENLRHQLAKEVAEPEQSSESTR